MTPTRMLREVDRRFTILTPFREASLDPVNRVAECVIITEGLGNLRDRNYYTPEAVRSCVQIFEGRQFYIDHPSKSDDENRPERTIRDLGGWFFGLREATVKDADTGEPLTACVAKLRFDESAAGQEAWQKVNAAIVYSQQFPRSKDVYCGISINGGGVSHEAVIDNLDVNMVTEITEAFSADIVTKPARGGRFLQLFQEAEKLSAWKRGRGASQGGRMKTKDRPKPTTQESAVLSPEERARLTQLREEHLSRMGKDADDATVPAAPAPTKKKVTVTTEAALAKFRARLKEATEGLEGLPVSDDDVQQASPEDLVADLLKDLHALADAMGVGGGGGDAPAPGPADSAAPPVAHKKAPPPAAHDASAGAPDEGEDGTKMMYRCGTCNAENEVLPPSGYRLAAATETEHDMTDETETESEDEDETESEDEDETEAIAAETEDETEDEMEAVTTESQKDVNKMSAQELRESIALLQRRLDKKEQRFSESNNQHHDERDRLMRENIDLRAEVIAGRRSRKAIKMLKEAQVPSGILSVRDLLALPPQQWDFHVRQAKRAMKGVETQGGHGPSGGRHTESTREGGETDGVKIFESAYARN